MNPNDSSDAPDTGLSDEVETSQTEDTLSEDTELEDIEINLDELVDDDEAEAPTEETEDEAATEPDETEEDVEEEPETDVDTKPEDPKEPTEAERKRLNDEYAKRRIAEKQLREERQAREQENLQRYLDEAGDDEIERERRELEVEKHLIAKEKTTLAAEKIEIGLDKAVASIDLFQKGTPEQLNAMDRAYQNYLQMHVQYDQRGNVVSVDKDVTTYLTEEAETIRQLSSVGARQQEKDKKIVRSRTDTIPVRKQKESKVDPYLAAFQEEANRY